VAVDACLLDTRVLLWIATDAAELTAETRRVVTDPASQVSYSGASL
jgi:PIN domain nuclease of toxin-antitoxin system